MGGEQELPVRHWLVTLSGRVVAILSSIEVGFSLGELERRDALATSLLAAGSTRIHSVHWVGDLRVVLSRCFNEENRWWAACASSPEVPT